MTLGGQECGHDRGILSDSIGNTGRSSGSCPRTSREQNRYERIRSTCFDASDNVHRCHRLIQSPRTESSTNGYHQPYPSWPVLPCLYSGFFPTMFYWTIFFPIFIFPCLRSTCFISQCINGYSQFHATELEFRQEKRNHIDLPHMFAPNQSVLVFFS